jgi:hypothetical protein
VRRGRGKVEKIMTTNDITRGVALLLVASSEAQRALFLARGKVAEAEREVARLRAEAEKAAAEAERLADWAGMALVGKATVEVREDVIALTVPGKEGGPPIRRVCFPREAMPFWLVDLMHMEAIGQSRRSAP